MIRNRSSISEGLAVAAAGAVAWVAGGLWLSAEGPQVATPSVAVRSVSSAGAPSLLAIGPPVGARPVPSNDPTLPIEGEVIDLERPAVYRLPPVRVEEATEATRLEETVEPAAPVPNEQLPSEPTPPANERILEMPLPSDLAQELLNSPRRTFQPEGAPEFVSHPQSSVSSPEPPCPAPAQVSEPFATESVVAPYAPQFPQRRLFSPTSTELTAQLLPAVRRGCDLAQRGALYAAQTEFIQVIRRVAQANDAEHGTDGHSRALAEGLRALDEAADFVPAGADVEGELNVAIAASSHRTPVVRVAPEGVAPHTAVALYNSLAQERLAIAVGNHQAGSMALYGLGKVYSRLAERRDDDVLATRSAMTMYLAALTSCPSNHLAANELGVLLCRNGHAADAARMFELAIDQAPNATTYHNLAVAQQKLGYTPQSLANQREADRLASLERANGLRSRQAGVQWVAPDQFAQAGPGSATAPPMDPALAGAMPVGQNAPMPIPYTAAPAAPKSPLQRAAAIARSITGPATNHTDKTPATAPAPRPTIWH